MCDFLIFVSLGHKAVVNKLWTRHYNWVFWGFLEGFFGQNGAKNWTGKSFFKRIIFSQKLRFLKKPACQAGFWGFYCTLKRVFIKKRLVNQLFWIFPRFFHGHKFFFPNAWNWKFQKNGLPSGFLWNWLHPKKSFIFKKKAC